MYKSKHHKSKRHKLKHHKSKRVHPFLLKTAKQMKTHTLHKLIKNRNETRKLKKTKNIEKRRKRLRIPSVTNIWEDSPLNNNPYVTLDNDTIAVYIDLHGMLLGNSLCANMSDYKELEYLNKVSIGTYSCVNYISSIIKESIVNDLRIDLNDSSKVDFSYLSRKAYRKIRHKTPYLHAISKVVENETLINSDYHHKSFVYPGNNLLSIKFYSGSVTEEYQNRGIRLLYDGKKDRTNIELLSRDGFIIKLPETMFSKENYYSFTTTELIEFLLSKGYKKILIIDISCNILLDAEKTRLNETLCSEYF